jgi:hypothetical protein
VYCAYSEAETTRKERHITSFDDSQAIVTAVEKLVKPDGAGFELVGVDPAARSVSLRLVLDGVDCIECVLPRGYLEELSLSLLREELPEVERVVIEDPRDDPSFAATAAAH